MYRLHFDHRSASWVLQFLRFGFWWVTVQEGDTPLNFIKLIDAERYISERGIDKLYDRFVVKGLHVAYVLGLQNGSNLPSPA